MKRTRDEDEESKSDSDDEVLAVDVGGSSSDGAASGASTDYAYEDELDSGDNEDEDEPETRRQFVPVGAFSDLDNAFAARDQHNDFIYSYDTRYVSATTQGRVYKCVSHAHCGHRLKIKPVFAGAGGMVEHELLERDTHSPNLLRQASRHVISAAVRRDVNRYILVGFGASTVRNMLDHRYRGDLTMLNLVSDPSPNRKSQGLHEEEPR